MVHCVQRDCQVCALIARRHNGKRDPPGLWQRTADEDELLYILGALKTSINLALIGKLSYALPARSWRALLLEQPAQHRPGQPGLLSTKHQ